MTFDLAAGVQEWTGWHLGQWVALATLLGLIVAVVGYYVSRRRWRAKAGELLAMGLAVEDDAMERVLGEMNEASGEFTFVHERAARFVVDGRREFYLVDGRVGYVGADGWGEDNCLYAVCREQDVSWLLAERAGLRRARRKGWVLSFLPNKSEAPSSDTQRKSQYKALWVNGWKLERWLKGARSGVVFVDGDGVSSRRGPS